MPIPEPCAPLLQTWVYNIRAAQQMVIDAEAAGTPLHPALVLIIEGQAAFAEFAMPTWEQTL